MMNRYYLLLLLGIVHILILIGNSFLMVMLVWSVQCGCYLCHGVLWWFVWVVSALVVCALVVGAWLLVSSLFG